MPDIQTHPSASALPPNWFGTTEGLQWIQYFQQACLSELMRVYGHAGVFLRPCEECPSSLSGNMLAQVIGLHRKNRHFEGDFYSTDAQLPIADESLSLAYALCVLETSVNPEALFQELSRCLKAEGVLMLISLNGFSAGRLRWLGKGVKPLSEHQLERWCRENNLEIIKQSLIVPVYGAGRGKTPPRQSRFGLLTPFYAGRLLVAKRRVIGLTPLRKTKRSYQLNPRVSPG